MKLPRIMIFFMVIAFMYSACSSKADFKDREQLVLIETDYGVMKIKLYNETPLHRDNFIKLVKDQYYDGLLFHRVISNFMIQSGDPNSRAASHEVPLGNGGPGYEIPAEFHPNLFHKKGAIAAARKGDQVNPEKRSSGSQFYIVHGDVFSEEELEQIELRINNMFKQSTFFKYVEEEKQAYIDRGDSLDYSKIQENAALKTEEVFMNTEPYRIPDAQRNIYETMGGTPHLDQNYTVFGEVVEGLSVVDSIAGAATGTNDRPLEDIRIIRMKLVRK
jgi:cyclophilin family peptidyl-prolyl cis-trans isomerase